MRVTIITVGSRGDAQPYVALAAGLVRRGHRVTVATHEIFRPLVLANDIDFVPVAGDPAAIVAAADRWMATGRGRDAVFGLGYFLRVHGPLLDALLADYWRVAQGSDLLIYSDRCVSSVECGRASRHPRHRRGTPTAAPNARLPISRRACGASPRSNVQRSHVCRDGSARVERATASSDRLASRPARTALPSQWRGPFARLGSPAAATPTIYGYSPSVVPRPADWDPHVRVTGYWPLLPRAQIGDRRQRSSRFLDAGAPPVSIGFREA